MPFGRSRSAHGLTTIRERASPKGAGNLFEGNFLEAVIEPFGMVKLVQRATVGQGQALEPGGMGGLDASGRILDREALGWLQRMRLEFREFGEARQRF